jgi:hypothetical protein
MFIKEKDLIGTIKYHYNLASIKFIYIINKKKKKKKKKKKNAQPICYAVIDCMSVQKQLIFFLENPQALHLRMTFPIFCKLRISG